MSELWLRHKACATTVIPSPPAAGGRSDPVSSCAQVCGAPGRAVDRQCQLPADGTGWLQQVQPFGFTAYHGGTGAHQGRVYVTFTSEVSPARIPGTVPCPATLPSTATCVGQEPLSEEAFISHSDDGGETWSRPRRLATQVPNHGVKRMWPVPSVEPDGSLSIVYYESREASTSSNSQCVVRLGSGEFRVGPANSLVNTLLVQSADGGETFGHPVRVTTVTSNWCTTVSDIHPNFGDYIGGTSGADRVFPIWADGRNGIPDTFFAPILKPGE